MKKEKVGYKLMTDEAMNLVSDGTITLFEFKKNTKIFKI